MTSVPWSGDEVPASLDAVMRAALRRVLSDGSQAAGFNGSPADTQPSPEQLGEAALVCLREAARRGEDRSAAIHLLGADALMTAACEQAAAAGEDPVSALRVLCDAFDVERIAARLGESP